MTTIPALVPPLPRAKNWNRDVAPSAAFSWLAAGWRDLMVQPLASLAYGTLVFLVSLAIVVGLVRFGWDYILFPAFAGFMVVGPILAVGLYEKSRRIAAGEPVGLAHMIFVRPKSGGQILFTGVLLCLLDAGVDARSRHHLCAVLRTAAVSGTRSYRPDAVHHTDRMGHVAGRGRGRSLVRRILVRHQRVLDPYAAQ